MSEKIICESCESIYTQASYKIEELEQKLAIAVEALEKLAKSGDGSHGSNPSFYDSLPTLQIEFSERKLFAREALAKIRGME